MRIFLVAALLVAGCANDFDPSSYLKPGQLRVLGVVADPPQAAPGETSKLTVITPNDPNDVTWEWSICTQPPPPGTASVDELCLEADLGAGILIPVDSTTSTAKVTMPVDASPRSLGLPDATGGFYVPVRIRARMGDQQLDAVYGLRLAIPQLPPNHDPVVDSAALVSEPLDASPMLVSELSTDPTNPTPVAFRTQPTLRLTLTDDSYEVYPQLTGAPPNIMITMTTEKPRFLWFADAGFFSQDATGRDQPDTKLKLDDDKHRAPALGDLINLWVVVHDDRGGTTFTHRYLVVQ